MKVLEAIETMLRTTGETKAGASRAMGKHENWLSTTIYKRSDPQVTTLADLADVLGYKLILEGHGEQIEIDPKPDREN